MRLHCAAERAARVAEEFRLEQRFGNRAAIDAHERPRAAAARAVNRVRQKLFAGSRFAENEHARIGVGNEPCLPQQVLHPRATGDDASAPFAARLPRRLGSVTGQSHRIRDFLQQLLAVEWLGKEGEYAALRCRHGVGNRPVRGQDDDRQRRMLAMDRVEQLQPVDPGHPHIGDDRRRSRDCERRERCLAAVGGAHTIPRRGQPQADQLEQVRIVVDQQDVGGLCHGSIDPSRRRRPRPRRRRCGCARAGGCVRPRAVRRASPVPPRSSVAPRARCVHVP